MKQKKPPETPKKQPIASPAFSAQWCMEVFMEFRNKLPRIITKIFYLQLALFLISILILMVTAGVRNSLAYYAIEFMIYLVPVVSLLTLAFPIRQWAKHGSIILGIAMSSNALVCMFVMLQFLFWRS